MPRLRNAFFVLIMASAVSACPHSEAAPLHAVNEGALDPAQVPGRGSPEGLDVASWNIEWFGAPSHGPRDELLQLANVGTVIRRTDADIWGVAEIVDGTSWRRLTASLPGYAGFLADDPSVRGGAAAYSRREQKLGILYKADLVRVTGARVILAYADAAFAGRPPLEVTMRVSVGGSTAELVVIVLHMKAFADDRSRQRRRAAGAHLKAYLDWIYPTQNVLVIGDWNDDVDVSIVPRRATPYAPFIRDQARYRFITAPLSAARISSTTRYPDLVDHHLATNEMAALESAPAEVHRADRYIAAFSSTTSDHFPVITHYRLRGRQADAAGPGR